ncbi:hypothetical protein BOSE62_70522 [Bosea sp. 62]|nr:hypothetical protein BOSE7B_50357 [Bosea sp. 7B]CAD5299896.1 hypothetical protein BOSE21B_91138 [Bosea sp. 21B]CAD5300479.1 hypothetical protein BOSE46_90035 [Bosea sp. 46]VVT61788.1 hypothetical protein BOS5A_231065 [Bosea sp. EC-HK365B]VXB02569.1 hypothetical protein BOSE127_100025 [Bosea sp. 127]VXB41782.1 hypothetical protein BOSE125_130727 [Bosea sp. 125]VXC77156.1 hypothetical protein BOSE62_70522 [Bosea sp. 62]VXC89417.1 hypothetical protein BOSE29B_81088 [Bosea sp. 29B]
MPVVVKSRLRQPSFPWETDAKHGNSSPFSCMHEHLPTQGGGPFDMQGRHVALWHSSHALRRPQFRHMLFTPAPRETVN